MKILVTGAAGFIASHLAEHLRNLGHEVEGLDNFSAYYSPETKQRTAKILAEQQIPVHRIDLRHPEALAQLPADFDYIFHLAAQSGISAASTFEDYLSNNLIGTKNLVDFALRNESLRLFTNISTSSVYGLDACHGEDKAPEPVSFYGTTKLAAEQLVLSQSREQKLRAVSLRLYSVYGPRERPEKLYPKLIASAVTGEPFTLYDGGAGHLRSFTYVGDIVNGISSVIGRENSVDGEVINVGTSEQHSTLEGIQAVERIMGRAIRITIVPPRAGDQLRTYAVIDKAKRLLGYEPKVTLEEGLRKQVAWFEAQNSSAGLQTAGA